MADDHEGFIAGVFSLSSGGRGAPIQDLQWRGLCLGPNKGADAQAVPYVPGMVFRDSNCWRHNGPEHVFLSGSEIDARLAKRDYWDQKGYTSLSLAIGQSSLKIAARKDSPLQIVTAEDLASSDGRFLDKLHDTPADYHRRQDVLARREARQAARMANPAG